MKAEITRQNRIDRLFAPEFVERLLQADEADRMELLKAEIGRCVSALPPVCHERGATATADELRIARELCEYKMPLQNGDAIEMGLPYDWHYGVDDGHVGDKAPRYIVPRIAFSGTLVRAYEHTGDRAYAQALRDYVVDYVSRYWVDSTELPERENWLCTACRCGTWHGDLFAGIYVALTHPDVVACFSLDDLLAVFRAIDNMMTGLIPNLALGSNWRVHQVTNIFTQGFVWRFLKRSPLWLDLAVNALNEEFDVQFHEDGSHEELCSHYGAGTWQVFAAYHALSEQAPDVGIRFDGAKMRRCMDYVLSSCRPFGLLAPLGDDYATRTPAMLDGVSPPHPADEPVRWVGVVRRGAAWLAGSGGFPGADFVTGGEPVPGWTSRRHRDSGYMFMRDGWTPHSLYADFNMGTYSGCHCHYGLLGIQVAGFGREFIVDPGCSALDARAVNANMARTRAHSTMCVDGLDQQVAVPVQTSRCFTGDHYDFAVGVYKGGYRSGNSYGPGTMSADRFDACFSGSHFRHILFVKGSYWIVFDALSTQPGHTAETRFQFLPNPMRTVPGGYATGWQESNLAILALHWEGWEHGIHEGETDPIEGWMPAPGGKLVPAPVYKATRSTDTSPLWHGTVLFPYRQAELPRITIAAIPVNGLGFGYRIETDAYTDYLFLSNSWAAADVALDGISTNAPLLHIRYANGTLVRGCACEGTYLDVDGQEIFNAPGTMLAREFGGATGANVRTMQPRK